MSSSKPKRSKFTNHVLIYAVRYILLASIAVALGSIVFAIWTRGFSPESTVVIGNNLRIIALSSLAMVITIAVSRIQKQYDIHLPRGLMAMIMVLIVASIVLGDAYGQYDRFWWWDDVLHLMSGVMMAMIGFLLVYFFNARFNMRINPLFIATFAFTFAITMGVIWEIIEFSFDFFIASNMQSWIVPEDAVLMGKEYQGNALRDTMSDLIVACIGAIPVSVAVYLSYANNRHKMLRIMRRTFPSLAQKKSKPTKI